MLHLLLLIRYPKGISLIQDLAMDYSVIGESFETSVPWNMVEKVCRNVKSLLMRLVGLPSLTVNC